METTTQEQLCNLSAVELVKRIRARTCTVVDVVRSSFDRIDEVEDRVMAWEYLNRDGVIQRAGELDQRLADGKCDGKLFGVPIGIKDIFNTFDMPTSMGSASWKNFTPGNDARVVHYLRRNDAVLLGKTVTAEFAIHAPGKTVNPHNPAYSPGTSSSGSAAAVASFMVPLSLGTQTAGSIIRPASYCGIYGFKPSFGLIPRTATLKTVERLDTVGMFARCPEDLELLFNVSRVRGPNFPVSDEILNDPVRQNKSDRPWRVGVVHELNQKFGFPYARKALADLISELEKSSEVRVVDKQLPREFEEAHDVHATIYDKDVSYYFQREFDAKTELSELAYEMMLSGRKITLDQYDEAVGKAIRLAALLDDFFIDCDVLLVLSTQGIAPLLTENDRPDTCLMWTLCGAITPRAPFFTLSV